MAQQSQNKGSENPNYQALGRNPLRDGIAVLAWVFLTAATTLLAAIGATGLQRRDLRQ
jgi:hypothetical protein